MRASHQHDILLFRNRQLRAYLYMCVCVCVCVCVCACVRACVRVYLCVPLVYTNHDGGCHEYTPLIAHAYLEIYACLIRHHGITYAYILITLVAVTAERLAIARHQCGLKVRRELGHQ
jgi:hypothetical protein